MEMAPFGPQACHRHKYSARPPRIRSLAFQFAKLAAYSQIPILMSKVSYELNDGIATIRMDDGKRNALSPEMFKELNAALDRAEADKAIVILTGRDEVFSAGFDLKVMKAGGTRTISMLRAGYSLTARILGYPYPVITACNGHVLAMGVFMMLASDYVIGSEGDFKISANEVAIGMPFPRVAEEMMRLRLRPADFQRAVVLAEYFSVEKALAAGFFDEVVAGEALLARANAVAGDLSKLDMWAHKVSKQRVRKTVINRIRRNIPLDLKDAVLLGVRGALSAGKKGAKI